MPRDKRRYKLKKNPGVPEKTGFLSARPQRVKTPDEKREYLKLFLFLITWVIFLSAVYMVCLQLEFEPVMPVYTGLGAVLFFVWVIYNGGVKKIDTEKMEKPEETSYEEFCAFVDKLKTRQKKAKYILVLFIPFPVIMLADYVIMVWGERIFG
ncbi:MAG: hypothetical protein FWH24_05435 [Oscillospiraceae bacterium]|nr:hypothetical protein [Oscillospiraceae bacterium]